MLFEWHSVGNIPLSESYQPLPKNSKRVYDPVHINSIDEEPNGDLLVSARHTHTVYKIDRSTAKIEWRLGGRRSSFDAGGEKLFAWQHDARRLKDGTITLFDNAASEARPNVYSRGLKLRLARARSGARPKVAPSLNSRPGLPFWAGPRATCRRSPAAMSWSAGAGRSRASPSSTTRA